MLAPVNNLLQEDRLMRIVLISMVMLTVANGNSLAQDVASLTSHERAAAELVDVLQLEKLAMTTVDVMAQAMSGQGPISPELMDLIVEFTKEGMRWEDLRPDYIRIYRDAYTEAELRELIAFYRSPVGRKTIEMTPELMKRMTEIRQKRMQERLPELQRRIRVRLAPDTLHSRAKEH